MNHVDTFGQTAFFYCCREGHFETCKLLIDCGSDVNHVDNDGITPLFYCIRSGSIQLLKILIEKGVDLNHTDMKGFTPYQLCKQINASKEMTDLLVKNGAKVIECLPALQKSSKKKEKEKTSRSRQKPEKISSNKRFKTNELVVEVIEEVVPVAVANTS